MSGLESDRENLQANLRAAVRDWLKGLMERHGVNARDIARRTGISASTVYRALEDDGEYVTSTTKLNQIAVAYGETLPRFLQDDGPVGFSESSEEFGIDTGKAFTLRGRALDLEGYLPGDLLIVDESIAPVTGDVVCAQVYQMDRGVAETVFRVFAPPYLLTHSTDRNVDPKPLYVDNERVRIVGTVVRMMRNRAA